MRTMDLSNIGLTDIHLREAAKLADSLHLARVSAQHKDMYKVIVEAGEISAEVSGKLKHPAYGSLGYPAVGDWVLVDRTDDKSGNAIITTSSPARAVSFERQRERNRIVR